MPGENLFVQFFRNPLRDGFRLHQNAQAGQQRQRPENAGKNFHRQIFLPADKQIQPDFHRSPANERGGDEPDEHQGSAFGGVHNHRLSGSGGLSDGSGGCAPTSPRYCVSRTNFKSAARASSPLAETATAGRSYFPSGSEKR